MSNDRLSSSIKISCGGNHTILVDINRGMAYGSGDNGSHQLGLDGIQYTSFVPLSNNPDGNEIVKWVAAATTWEASALVDARGFIYTSGLGLHGELGSPEFNSRKSNECFSRVGNVQVSSQVIKTAAGLRHILLLCENGDVWGWGANRKGQVGYRDAIVSLPRKIATGIKDIGCGKDFSVLLNKNNTLKVLGSPRHLDEHFYNLVDSTAFQLEVMAVAWTSIHLLMRDSQGKQSIQSFGNNSHGQLYKHSGDNHEFLVIAAGTEHYLAVELSSESWTIYSWGWGEHGNCGSQYKEADTKSLFKVCEFDRSLSQPMIHGGYSSSWIITE
ncbi:uncharacterized protein SAPINGB_P005605 [Magnusiomyces paraingens]|uniref:Uncharacterized protein n=1 Tax=Magnusiomyces paraingens TaxID=2606893 RepID=A0A5E8C1L0_9ASCO|nr:uncharacterized protein SAPINGB_P005605 [Saprochaete ingens]VVT57242.1 unnamed protein product [Saprochaete ingens]